MPEQKNDIPSHFLRTAMSSAYAGHTNKNKGKRKRTAEEMARNSHIEVQGPATPSARIEIHTKGDGVTTTKRTRMADYDNLPVILNAGTKKKKKSKKDKTSERQTEVRSAQIPFDLVTDPSCRLRN
jgi:hypothetical protein